MRRSLSAVIVGVALTLSGCSSTAPDPDRSSTAPVQHGHGDAHAGIDPGPAIVVPTWTAADARDASAAALVAMRAFAGGGSPEEWYEKLAGRLTATGQAAFYGTDPAQVPVHRVDAVTVTSPSPYLVEAVVGTDVGPYRVLLVREGARRPWLVERIEPAA